MRRRLLGRRKRPDHAEHRLRRRAEQDRIDIGIDHRVIGEDLGGDLRVGRAADVEQQAYAVHVPGSVGIHAEAFAQAHGEERAADPVFELHAECEVGGKRQRSDHLRRPHSSLREPIGDTR